MLSVHPKINAIMLEEQGIEYMLKVFEALEIVSYQEEVLHKQLEQKAPQQQRLNNFS